METLETIGTVLGSIGDFIASIPEAISKIINFIFQCISECTALLGVIPTAVGAVMTTCLVFSVVLAVKRLVID